jgi:hypothetical protein
LELGDGELKIGEPRDGKWGAGNGEMGDEEPGTGNWELGSYALRRDQVYSQQAFQKLQDAMQ